MINPTRFITHLTTAKSVITNMNNEWQQFLQQQGASLDDLGVQHFADAANELNATADKLIIADLSHYGLIAAEGEEAESFLQNQFSNDVRQVSDTHSQLNAYCSPKGRMLASFQLFRRANTYYLRMPHSILQPTLKRLRMFIMRSQVALEDASDQLVRFGIAGTNAIQVLQGMVDTLPKETNAAVEANGVTIIRLSGPTPRFECYADVEATTALWKRLARQATPVGRDCWHWLNIQAGVPDIFPETVEAFVPQMVNLAALDAINFKKGCYPGQEVVARMHYLGKLKRRMYLAHTEQGDLPAPGDAVFGAQQDEQSVGKVVLAQSAPGGGNDLLVVLQISAAENAPLHLEQHDGPTLFLRELPYTVTNEA